MAGFELNSAHKFEIDTAQDQTGTGATYERVAAGINSFDPQWNEEIDQTPYLDGEGFGSSDVTSAQLVITFEGHRKYGDPAQDFVAGLQIETGEARKTNFRWTDPSGDMFEGWVTVANIVGASGAANEKSTFSFEVHFNGKPTFTEAGTGA
ncbi:phage tail tube protein [Cytobacillus pseudoceanisediminis]|uniref:phage tail tube protein n=1 Tax=Cytobacillus pseudoceanisediminis TaxID=3051614 RepID=UPI00365C0D78